MHFLRIFTIFMVLLTTLFLTYCTSPTKTNKKTTQTVLIENIDFSEEVDRNDNGYFSSTKLNFTIRVTSGEIEAHILMGLYRESDDELVSGGILEYITITESNRSYYFEISDFPRDTYWIALLVMDPEDEENVYVTETPETKPALGDLNLESSGQDVGFYARFNNYTFSDIDLTVEGMNYNLPRDGTLIIEFDDNPGSVTLDGTTFGKTGDTQRQIGMALYWNNIEFNTVGLDSLVRDLTIGPEFFFLFMQNNSGYGWSPIEVNVGQSTDNYFYEEIRIPADGGWYRTGYFRKFADTRVDAHYEDYPAWEPIVWSAVEFEAYFADEYPNSSYIAALSYPASAKVSTNDILLKARPIGGNFISVDEEGHTSKVRGSKSVPLPNTSAR
jgi:hypothetical protein